jgi:hypoxanthine-guanine phosphoribosyltransferase
MKDIEEVLVPREQISEMVKSLGKRISEDYAGEDLVLV